MKKRRKSMLPVIIMGGVFVFSSLCGAAPVMVEKNLFAPDRKPPLAESEPAKARENAPDVSAQSIQLDGVMMYGNTKKALLRYKRNDPAKDKQGGKAPSPFTVVAEGEKLGEYVVKKIESRSISLETGGQITEVKLFAEGKIVPPPPPVPTPQFTPDENTGNVPGEPNVDENNANQPPGEVSPGSVRPPGTAGTDQPPRPSSPMPEMPLASPQEEATGENPQ